MDIQCLENMFYYYSILQILYFVNMFHSQNKYCWQLDIMNSRHQYRLSVFFPDIFVFNFSLERESFQLSFKYWILWIHAAFSLNIYHNIQLVQDLELNNGFVYNIKIKDSFSRYVKPSLENNILLQLFGMFHIYPRLLTVP